MKTIVFLFFFTLSINCLSQDLKGYSLGKKYNTDEIHTTVGGIPGLIQMGILNDNTVYTILFVPSEDGKHKKRLYSSEVDVLVNGFKKKFGLTKKLVVSKKYSKDKHLLQTINGIQYFISVKHNEYKDIPCDFVFSMTSLALEKKKDEEKQSKADNDF